MSKCRCFLYESLSGAPVHSGDTRHCDWSRGLIARCATTNACHCSLCFQRGLPPPNIFVMHAGTQELTNDREYFISSGRKCYLVVRPRFIRTYRIDFLCSWNFRGNYPLISVFNGRMNWDFSFSSFVHMSPSDSWHLDLSVICWIYSFV